MEPPRWSEGASQWAHEREALAFVRNLLPNYDPWRAWSNVEFIADDGSVNEVDLLVVSSKGLFLVEIKSWPGTLLGDGQQWRHRWPDGRERSMEHPLILANRKAKRLKSLLSRRKAFAEVTVPWVQALVFVSSAAVECRLHDVGRIGVCGRDSQPTPHDPTNPAPAPGHYSPLPGIVATLKDPTLAQMRPGAVNKPLSERIDRALGQVGLNPINRGRSVGDWDLAAVLDEGPGWQDFAASRRGVGVRRRVRVYLAGLATSAEEEQRLRDEATREFKVMAGIEHEGIARPLDLVQSERGPALLFDRVEHETRLDVWAGDGVAGLELAERVQLVRELIEAVAHAHSHRIAHRGLTARSVMVRLGVSGTGPPRLVIGHWQSAARDLATQLTAHPSVAPDLATELADRLSADEQVYLAPETFTAESPDGVALDTFSLGALGVLLLSGRPPAGDLAEREQQFEAHSGLSLDAVADRMPAGLAELVASATDPVPGRRATLREMLAVVDDVLDDLTAPAAIAVTAGANAGESAAGESGTSAPGDAGADMAMVDPLSANKGDRLDGGWEVQRRLGGGSTAVALLCIRPGLVSPQVLKVARDEDHAERLRDEERVLGELHHPCIVELAGIDRVGGRTTLRLSPAGNPEDIMGMTLADRLAQQGRIGLDLLDRFGDDLFDVLAYLESEGIRHRDIKPDNLGVRKRRGDGSLHLVLFDFSLTRTPDTNLTAGTPGYLDPFLTERPVRRYDSAADRYAAAVTLYEMATGTRPHWGDGRTDPIRLPDNVAAIEPSLLDPTLRDAMAEFFRTALARSSDKRFDTSDQMRQSWRAVFASSSRPTTQPGDGADGLSEVARSELIGAAIPGTPVGELGLSGAAVAALERLGVSTARQLADFSAVEWNRSFGVGIQARREAAGVASLLRDHFGTGTPDPAASIDRLADQLVSKSGTDQANEDRDALVTLLGLSENFAGNGAATPWPGLAEVGADYGLSRGGYEVLLDRARSRWAKLRSLTVVRHDVKRILEGSGGILSADDVVLALLAQRGSTASGAARRARGRAVLRAALETESALTSSRLTWRRLGGGAAAVVALSSEVLDGQEMADYAADLGRVADDLATADDPASPSLAVTRLRRIPQPEGLAPLSDHRLVRLAVASSATASVSSRLEIYPRRLSPARAIHLARPALLSATTITEDDVRSRVATRFPDAQDLPASPDLARLLREVGLVWCAERVDARGMTIPAGYAVPPPPDPSGTGLPMSGPRYRTGTMVSVPDEERAVAESIQERLERSADRGGYLVITVTPAHYARALEQLAVIGASIVDLDAVVIEALRSSAAKRRVNWDTAVLTADAAGPAGPNWARLQGVVADALQPLAAQLLSGDRHQLLFNPGLLARYGRLGLLDELREAVTRRLSPEDTLRTLWVLVPALDPKALAAVDGAAVAVTTSAERLALPTVWMTNLHKTRAAGVPA